MSEQDCRKCPHATVLFLFVTAHWYCTKGRPSRRRIGNYPDPESGPITPPEWCPLKGGGRSE